MSVNFAKFFSQEGRVGEHLAELMAKSKKNARLGSLLNDIDQAKPGTTAERFVETIRPDKLRALKAFRDEYLSTLQKNGFTRADAYREFIHQTMEGMTGEEKNLFRATLRKADNNPRPSAGARTDAGNGGAGRKPPGGDHTSGSSGEHPKKPAGGGNEPPRDSAPQATAFDPNAMGAKKAQIEASDAEDKLKREGFFERRNVFRVEATPERVSQMSEFELSSIYSRVTGYIGNSFNPKELGVAGETLMDEAATAQARAAARAAGKSEAEIDKITVGGKKTDYFFPVKDKDGKIPEGATGYILATKKVDGTAVPELLDGVQTAQKDDVLKVFKALGDFGVGNETHIHPNDWKKVKAYVDQRTYTAGMGKLLSAVDGSERMGTAAVARKVPEFDGAGKQIGEKIVNDPSDFESFAASLRALGKVDELAVRAPGTPSRTYTQVMDALSKPGEKISVDELNKIQRGLKVDQSVVDTLRQNVMLIPDASARVKAFDSIEAIANKPATLLGEPLLSANAARATNGNVNEVFERIRRLEQVHPDDFALARREAYTARYQELLGRVQSSSGAVDHATTEEISKMARAMGVLDVNAPGTTTRGTLASLSTASSDVNPASLEWLFSGNEGKYKTAVQDLAKAASVPGTKIDVRATMQPLNELRNIPNSPLVAASQARMSPKAVLEAAAAGEPISSANWDRMSTFMQRHHDSNKKGLSGVLAKLDFFPDALSVRRAVEYNTSVGSTLVPARIALPVALALSTPLTGGINVNDDPGSMSLPGKTLVAMTGNPINTLQTIASFGKLDPTPGTTPFTDTVLENMNAARATYVFGTFESNTNHQYADKPFGYARHLLATYLLEGDNKGKLLKELSPEDQQAVIARVEKDNFIGSPPADVASALRMYTAQQLLGATSTEAALAAATQPGFKDTKAKNVTAEAGIATANASAADATRTKTAADARLSGAPNPEVLSGAFGNAAGPDQSSDQSSIAVSPRNGAQIKSNLDALKVDPDFGITDTEYNKLSQAWASATKKTVAPNIEMTVANEATPQEMQEFANQAQQILAARLSEQNARSVVQNYVIR